MEHELQELSSHSRVGTEPVLHKTELFTKPGLFRLEFDNTYSWMNSKKVKYTVRIHAEAVKAK